MTSCHFQIAPGSKLHVSEDEDEEQSGTQGAEQGVASAQRPRLVKDGSGAGVVQVTAELAGGQLLPPVRVVRPRCPPSCQTGSKVKPCQEAGLRAPRLLLVS